MFKPSKGPKEGRSPPGLLYTGNPAGRTTRRQVSIVVAFFLLICLGYFVYNTDSGTISSAKTTVQQTAKQGAGGLGAAILNDAKNAAPAADAIIPEVHTGKPAVQDASPRKVKPKQGSDFPSGQGLAKEGVKDIKEPLDVLYKEPADSPSLKKIKAEKEAVEAEPDLPASYGKKDPLSSTRTDLAPAREKWSERPTFERALENVIRALPDEMQMRELIRKVDGTGKERMREMGLRTRAYKKYFDLWEALHLTTDDEGATYIRDDVIQYLRSHQHVKPGQLLDDEKGGIAGLNVAQTIRAYESYRAFLQRFAALLFPWTSPYFADHMSLHAYMKKGGRGIVLTAGDDQAPYLLTTIYSFRQLGCTLPIEVMYLGDQDLGEDYRADLEALPGVVTRDIAQMTNDEGWRLAGWAAKPFAMLYSSFREVIFIDADSMFFKNPEILFDDPDYIENGALFFRDRLIMPESKKRWLQQVLPKPISKRAKESRFWTGESGHMQESGVVVVDKWKHFMSLLLITRLNGPDRDGNKEKGIIGVYDMMYGDKETFWIGFLLAGDEKYAFHKGDAGIMGELEDMEEKKRKDEEHERERRERERRERERRERNHEKRAEAEDEEHEEHKRQDGDAHDTAHEDEVHHDGKQVVLHEEDPTATICAPQLLHLDTNGKPLWFNGWLLHNKFADKKKKEFAKFEKYLIEPSEVREPGAWQIADSNICCLTSDVDKLHEFTKQERDVLNMILARAHEMGMGNQS